MFDDSISHFLFYLYYYTTAILLQKEAYCDSVLGLCVAYDEWESVLEVLDIMKRQGWTQERSSYSACLQACFETGNGASAQEILQAMEKATVDPTPSDIGLTVAAMCRNNHHNHNRHKNNHDNNTHTSTTTTNQPSAAAPTRWWRNALGLIQSTATNTKTAGGGGNTLIPVQAYDAVLECMVEERQWKEAVRLLRAMEEGSSPQHTKGQPIPSGGLHPAPEISTYREVIECCVTTNQAEQAVQVLYSMKKRGVKVRTRTAKKTTTLERQGHSYSMVVVVRPRKPDTLSLSLLLLEWNIIYIAKHLFVRVGDFGTFQKVSLASRRTTLGIDGRTRGS